MSGEENKRVRWLPLESNPQVMTRLLRGGGVPEPWNVTDVFGLDPDLLVMVPQPVKALILLFPMTEASEKFMKERAESMSTKDYPSGLFYTHQTVSNACGTVALLHSVGNSTDAFGLKDDSVLGGYYQSTKDLGAAEKAKFLETCQSVAELHKNHAQALLNSTETPDLEDEAEHHFIAFVHHGGALWELDGRKPLPINCGPSKPEDLLLDASKECQKYMAADPDNMKFSLMAFTGGSFD